MRKLLFFTAVRNCEQIISNVNYCPSTCLPPLSMQSSARLCISLNTLFIISESSLKFANPLTIRSLVSSIGAGGVVNTFPFTKHQRKNNYTALNPVNEGVTRAMT